jgi:hypothetical protein
VNREFHEVANIFPMMQGEEFDALKADIAANGLREPIWLHPDGRIIDGRNRYRACCELSIEPEYHTWNGSGSLVSFVVSLNLHRRHLTARHDWPDRQAHVSGRNRSGKGGKGARSRAA